MFAAGHGQAHAEEEDAETGGFHALGQVLQLFQGEAGLRHRGGIHRLPFDQSPQGGEDLEILAGPNLQKNVRGLGTGSFPNIDQDHCAVLTPAGSEFPLLGQRVTGEVPGMALCRVASPIDDQVGPIFDFPQGT